MAGKFGNDERQAESIQELLLVGDELVGVGTVPMGRDTVNLEMEVNV